jgi:hypothetical protein
MEQAFIFAADLDVLLHNKIRRGSLGDMKLINNFLTYGIFL